MLLKGQPIVGVAVITGVMLRHPNYDDTLTDAPISLVMRRAASFRSSGRFPSGRRRVMFSGQGKVDDEYRNSPGIFAWNYA
jgi:hypothetical protein